MNTKDMQFISFLDKVKTAEHASLIESIKTAYATIVENEVTSVEDYSDIMALWRAAEEAEAAHRKALRELGSKLGPVLKSIKTSSDWGDFMSAPAIRSAIQSGELDRDIVEQWMYETPAYEANEI